MGHRIIKIAVYSAIATFGALSCVHPEEISFALDASSVEMPACGGTKTIALESPQQWVARTQEPWITVSPANGNGSTECSIIVDSALSATAREGIVRIELIGSGERKDISVKQSGFDYQIVSEKTGIEIDSYADYGSRSFDITVNTNVPFEIVIPDEAASWLSCKAGNLELDRGLRPRNVTLHFDWDVNFVEEPRSAEVLLRPKDTSLQLSRNDNIDVRQHAAEPIEIGIKGDSLSLIAIARALKCMREFDTNERMEYWSGVTVWKSGPNKGRVRSASFILFDTKEGLPYQVRNLTAAENLSFFGNANTFLKDLDPGNHICELTQLTRLTVSAYGLVSLPESFTKLKNLEYLDLSGNNFTRLPELLSKENFPKLHSLILNANQRSVVYDLSNTNKTDLGGFIDECLYDDKGNRTFPRRFLAWENLDTLVLSVNYLQGTLPDFEDDPQFPRWTAEEVNACDTLPQRLIGLPKVLPKAGRFSINLNHLTGTLPDWLLYHPSLDLWIPDLLVFEQYGKDEFGNNCGFSNTPANLDYYYKEYPKKKYNPNNTKN